MTFLGLVLHNVWVRKVRSGLTAVAVAIGVATVVTLGVVTASIRSTAVAILQTGKADFTVAQKGTADVLNSTIDQQQVDRIAHVEGVASVVGALVATTKLDAGHPLFVEIGIPPSDLTPFGVTVVAGRAFTADATGEVMLGWRAADDLGKSVGNTITIDSVQYRVVGIYSTGQALGDAGAMFPLVALQAAQREPGIVTLAFVRVAHGVNVDTVRKRIEQAQPVLTTLRTAAEFGRADRNLVLITAVDHAATIVTVVVGAVIVMDTMLLSFFERVREFGVLRAVGWSRLRITALVVGEALVIGFVGAAVGTGLAYLATRVLQHVSELAGVLHPTYGAGVFGRALITAAVVAIAGAAYPAARAALLVPLEALRRE